MLFDLRRTDGTPRFDPERSLAYSATGSSVDLVLVDGDVVVEDGTVTRLDEAAVIDEARSRARLSRAARISGWREAEDASATGRRADAPVQRCAGCR